MATTNYPPPTPPHHFQQQQVHHIEQFPQVQPASQFQTQTQPQYKTQFQTQAKPVSHPPLTQTRPQPQSRKSRSFSFRSDKSHGSNNNNNNNNKADLTETHLEKEAKRLHTKADPTLAMNEQEPAAVAATGKSSLASLRAMQHKDAFGNPIAEPDRSNPTRSRWERPLDTIRSFEAAIDGNYSNRKSFIRPDSDSAYNSRRTSYYGGNNGAPGRFSHDSYYNNRPPSMMYANRPDGSQPDLRQSSMGQRDPYYDQQQGYNGYAQNGGQRRAPRTAPEYPGYRQQNPNEYTIPSNHRSYETVASASGSGSSAEPAGYQTDPTSSDNSSVDRMHAVPRRQPESINDYGIGFTQESEFQAPTFTVGVKTPLANGGIVGDAAMAGYPQTNGAHNYGNSVPPAPPQKDKVLRKPTNAQHTQQPPQRPAAPEKRKSWFARRFSKQA